MLLFLLGSLLTGHAFSHTEEGEANNTVFNFQGSAIQVTANTEGRLQTVTIPASELIFNLTPHFYANGDLINFDINLEPQLMDLYKKIGPSPNLKTVFVYPIFTQAAYNENGFYYYYHGKCGTSCLTVSIPKPAGVYAASGIGSVALHLLGYPFVTDVDIDKNPDILKQYDRVIVLHNEYVTKKEFDAITSHHDVIFLYPNALYAEVKTNYTSNTITLVRGHGYPSPSIRNGFSWQYDNSKYEYDVFCNNWTYYLHGGYSMLNCYPEYKILSSPELLALLQNSDPTQLLADATTWLRYQDEVSAHAMLADYDINGTVIPQWVQSPVLMTINDEITRSELLTLLDYLYQENIIR